MTTFSICAYNLAVLGGTAYYVFERGASGWWFLLAVLFLMGTKS